ncbi:coiled-coil-helix-coiled-coil-helix domain-containing protein 5-like [Ptychodera flava]|uniref:coiled-coil-helix-coiled-coil-helix domain-containing protein 5-like n=1 Tax=Ptychodera flava TaxID=63121 RepID=UPI00396A5FD2
MDVVMQLVSKYCMNELEAYGLCVQNNPQDWNLKCNQYKAKVTECSSTHPGVQTIKKACVQEFATYDACLKENPQNVEKCVASLNQFLQCAESAAVKLEQSLKTGSGQELKSA